MLRIFEDLDRDFQFVWPNPLENCFLTSESKFKNRAKNNFVLRTLTENKLCAGAAQAHFALFCIFFNENRAKT